jgi:hypothetical protein
MLRRHAAGFEVGGRRKGRTGHLPHEEVVDLGLFLSLPGFKKEAIPVLDLVAGNHQFSEGLGQEHILEVVPQHTFYSQRIIFFVGQVPGRMDFLPNIPGKYGLSFFFIDLYQICGPILGLVGVIGAGLGEAQGQDSPGGGPADEIKHPADALVRFFFKVTEDLGRDNAPDAAPVNGQDLDEPGHNLPPGDLVEKKKSPRFIHVKTPSTILTRP